MQRRSPSDGDKNVQSRSCSLCKVLRNLPPAECVPGKRTEKFRLGGNELLIDSTGKSWISMEDFAIDMVDELEHLKHTRRTSPLGTDIFLSAFSTLSAQGRLL